MTLETSLGCPDQLGSCAGHLFAVVISSMLEPSRFASICEMSKPAFSAPFFLFPSSQAGTSFASLFQLLLRTLLFLRSFLKPSFFFPLLLHGHGILYVSVFAITTSALGKLGEMNLLCDKLNINSSKKHFEVFVCVCIFICQMNHLSYKKCGREKSNGNDNMITAHNSHKSSISVTHK